MRTTVTLSSLLLASVLATTTTAGAQDVGSLRIRVLESTTESPLFGARVTVQESAANTPLTQATSDADGRLRALRIPAGRVTVSVRRLGSVPLDTTVSVVSGSDLAVTFRLRSLSQLLGAVQVTADNLCPTGYGRLARTAPFASLLLAAVDSQLQHASATRPRWSVVESRRLLNESGEEVERSEIEWLAAEAPKLVGVSRDTLETLGYSWRVDSNWHFAVLHPSVFATQEFEGLHCFSITEEDAEASQEVRFVPSKRAVPNQLSGRLVFGGEPVAVERLDLYFRGARGSFADSAAHASIHFVPADNARVRISGWVVSAPARNPHNEAPRAMAVGVRVAEKLNARVEYRTEIRVDSAAALAPAIGDASMVLRKTTRSVCAVWSASQCLQNGIALQRNADGAPSEVETFAGVGYLAAVCRAGPTPVTNAGVRSGDSTWIRLPPAGLPAADVRAHLADFWEGRSRAPGRFVEAFATHVQLEACARLHLELARDPLLVAVDMPRDGLGEWACAQGEAASCVERAKELIARETSPRTHDAARSSSVRELLERGCFLRAVSACRQLAERDSTFAVDLFQVSRLRGDASTEPAAQLLRSRAANHLVSDTSPHARAVSDLATEVRALMSRVNQSGADVSMHPTGVLLTLHASDPDRISTNTFRPASEQLVDALGELLARRADVSALVVVHGDSAWMPAESRNRAVRVRQLLRLDESRVNAWNARLLRAGADRDRLRVQRSGDSEPLYSNLTRLGQQLNRRVEIALRLTQNGLPGGR